MRRAIPPLRQYVFMAWGLVKHGENFTFYKGLSNSFRITKYKLTAVNSHWEATQRVVTAKLTTLTLKIAIQLHLVAESCTICSSRSRRPVRKLLDTPSYLNNSQICHFQSIENESLLMRILDSGILKRYTGSSQERRFMFQNWQQSRYRTHYVGRRVIIMQNPLSDVFSTNILIVTSKNLEIEYLFDRLIWTRKCVNRSYSLYLRYSRLFHWRLRRFLSCTVVPKFNHE
jgi:hypothetical protein